MATKWLSKATLVKVGASKEERDAKCKRCNHTWVSKAAVGRLRCPKCGEQIRLALRVPA